MISTNIIRKEEIGDQSSSVSVAEASIHNFSTQNEGEIVGQDEWNSPPITCCYHQRISNQLASPANQRTVNQSPTAATQRTSNRSSAPSTQRASDESPAVVVTRPNPDQSSKFTPPLTVTLPKNTKERKQGSMFKDKAKKRKVNAMRTTQPNPMKKTEKEQCPATRTQTKDEKNQYNRGMEKKG